MVFVYRLLARLPLGWLHGLGGVVGRGVYWFSPTYRRHLRANMTQAGLTPGLWGPAAAEAGKQTLEVARIWLRTQAEANALVVEVVGSEHLDEARKAGRGVIFLTPHLGCFEITGQYLAASGDLTALYRPPKSAALQTLILLGRQRERLHLAPTNLQGVRSLVKALKRQEMVILVPDQAPKEGEGVWLRFFGRYAYTMTLAARLTETGAPCLMTWGERLPEGRGFRLHFSPPSQPLVGTTVERAQQINDEIERLVLACPTQYLWGYNRYKRPSGAEPPPGA